MSKDSTTPEDLISNMMGGRADKKPTKSTQKADKLPTAGPLKAYRVRIPENWWEAMKAHFKAQGKRPSEGLREIIRDYLERNST